jgi:phosphoribosylaminoimidazole-succinocarboxamide synthase
MIKTKNGKGFKGSTKIFYETDNPAKAVLSFEDTLRGSDESISGKGILTNRISSHLMTCLETIGLPTHFVRSLNMRQQEIKNLQPFDIVFRIRNVAAGSIAERLNLEEGTILPRPVIEFYYKKEPGSYNLVTEDHIVAFQWADPFEMEEMITIAYRSNDYLNGLFSGIGIRLVDFQMEVGRLFGEYGELYVMIADELSPDSMRLWDVKTNEPFGKNIEDYQEIAVRLGIIPREGLVKGGDVNETLAEELERIENILANDDSRKIRPIHKTPYKKGTTR